MGQVHFLFTITGFWLHRMAAGSVEGGHAQIWAVLVLSDHVSVAAEGGLGILVDGGPHVGNGWLSLAGSPLPGHHDPFAVCRRLHAHSLAVNEPVVAEGVASLEVIGFGAVRLLVPLDQVTAAGPHDHPLQMRGHSGSSSPGGSQRWKGLWLCSFSLVLYWLFLAFCHSTYTSESVG